MLALFLYLINKLGRIWGNRTGIWVQTCSKTDKSTLNQKIVPFYLQITFSALYNLRNKIVTRLIFSRTLFYPETSFSSSSPVWTWTPPSARTAIFAPSCSARCPLGAYQSRQTLEKRQYYQVIQKQAPYPLPLNPPVPSWAPTLEMNKVVEPSPVLLIRRSLEQGSDTLVFAVQLGLGTIHIS